MRMGTGNVKFLSSSLGNQVSDVKRTLTTIFLSLSSTLTPFSIQVLVNLIYLFLFIIFLLAGARQVGVYDYNPPTLTLKGSSQGNGTPVTLEYVHWPGTSCYVPRNSL